jgi:hypothetical protein
MSLSHSMTAGDTYVRNHCYRERGESLVMTSPGNPARSKVIDPRQLRNRYWRYSRSSRVIFANLCYYLFELGTYFHY